MVLRSPALRLDLSAGCARNLRPHRLQTTQIRSASSASENQHSIWRGQDPNTRRSWSVTGGLEWQTSAYAYNKNTLKTAPVAAMTVDKLLKAFVTMTRADSLGRDERSIRKAIASRRKSEDKIYVSKPRIKDFGTHVRILAFIFDGQEAAMKAQQTRSPSATLVSRTSACDVLLDPTQQAGLKSLIAKVYGKPAELSLIKLSRPHLDADILAAFVAQRLQDRRNTPRRIIRDATWKAPLPSPATIATIQQNKHKLSSDGGPKLSWQDFRLKPLSATSASSIADGLTLSRVSSVQVEAAGRLTKRLTANRSTRKIARRGANSKGPGYMTRGLRKAHVQYAFAPGKRRVGQYGVHVSLGHT